MTQEEFAKASGIHRWWHGVVSDPRFLEVVHQARPFLRFNEDQGLEHLEMKANGYRQCYTDLVKILVEMCSPEDGYFVVPRDEMDPEADAFEPQQDEALVDHVEDRFTGPDFGP